MINIYDTVEWKSLDKIHRAQILLINEGVKKGAFVDGNWTTFIYILDKLGLDYQLNTEYGLLNPSFTIGKTEDIREYNRRILLIPNNENVLIEVFKINGEFLEYSDCCIAEYSRERTPKEKESKGGEIHRSNTFGRELEEIITKDGTYPDIFDYTLPSFTPCSINCEKTKTILTNYKNVLEKNDPEAAKELVDHNRRSFPRCLIHKDYLQKEMKKGYLDYQIVLLKSSVK